MNNDNFPSLIHNNFNPTLTVILGLMLPLIPTLIPTLTLKERTELVLKSEVKKKE